MYKYLLYFVLFAPLVGILFMENGALGTETYDVGYPNQASLAFFLYISIILLSFFLVTGHKRFRISFKRYTSDFDFNSTGFFIMIINILLLFFILFIVGGVDVLTHRIEKGEFRASLGILGLPAYLIRDNIVPTLITYLSFVYIKSEKQSRKIIYLVVNYLIAGFIALSFGYKSSAVFALLPGFILLFWHISMKLFLKLSIFFLAIFVLTSVFIDKREFKFKDLTTFSVSTPDYKSALNSVLYRATVIEGNTSWKIWDKYKKGDKFFNYPPTLLAVFGDKFLASVFKISREDYPKFMRYHYTELLTFETDRRTLEEIQRGHTTIGQVFSEGIIAGGLIGMILFALFAGLFVGINYKIIDGAILNNNSIAASLMINYFVSYIISWLNGGGIATLFHISAIFGLLINYLLLITLILMQGVIKKYQYRVKLKLL